MAAVVRCGCGEELWADNRPALLDEVDRHVQEEHPELVDTLSPLELATPKHAQRAAA